MAAIREEDFLKSPLSIFLPATYRNLASLVFSAQSRVCLSKPSVYGGHYRLSGVISWGQIQYLTLCSLGGPFNIWTPVILSQPLTRR